MQYCELNLDIIFHGVSSLNIPTEFYGIEISVQEILPPYSKVYSLLCKKRKEHFSITAYDVRVIENGLNICESSLYCSNHSSKDESWCNDEKTQLIYPINNSPTSKAPQG
jgi:hypothetical protein